MQNIFINERSEFPRIYRKISPSLLLFLSDLVLKKLKQVNTCQFCDIADPDIIVISAFPLVSSDYSATEKAFISLSAYRI